MSDMITSNYQLNQVATFYAQSIFDEFKDENGGATFDAEACADDMRERAWEDADGSQHVIYTARAIAICGNYNTDEAESRLEDWYEKPFNGCETFADVCTRLAFATLLCEIESELQTLIDNWEPAEDDSDESDAE